MRHEKAETLLRIALAMYGSAEGISLDDIGRQHRVGRRTAERLRDALERLFPQMEIANPGEVPKRWCIRATAIRAFAEVSLDELAALRTAQTILRRENMTETVSRLELLAAKLEAMLRPETARRFAPDLEILAEAEGTAIRPGPRHQIDPELLAQLRYAVTGSLKVRLHYTARGTGIESELVVCPYGFLYGPRAYLVVYNPSPQVAGFRIYSLANVGEVEVLSESFERQPGFNLAAFAERSFGTFQEEPFDVVWRFVPAVAAKAREFVFHPSQRFEDEPDGSLLVRFHAGGAQEMCWHLFTWGDQVEVVAPDRLRDMYAAQCASALAALGRPRAGDGTTSASRAATG